MFNFYGENLLGILQILIYLTIIAIRRKKKTGIELKSVYSLIQVESDEMGILV